MEINTLDVAKRLENFIEYDAIVSPSAFAQKAGIDPSGFAKMLKGNMKITSNTLKKISATYGLQLDWLLTGDGEMYSEHLSEKNISISQNNSNNNQINESSVIIKLLAQLEEKDRQLKEKDKQIETLLNLLAK